MLPVDQRFCPKCGSGPGQVCKTKNGHRTALHAARRRLKLSRLQREGAIKLECWRAGFRAGVDYIGARQHRNGLAGWTLSPEDFKLGFKEGQKLIKIPMAMAQQRYLGRKNV